MLQDDNTGTKETRRTVLNFSQSAFKTLLAPDLFTPVFLAMFSDLPSLSAASLIGVAVWDTRVGMKLHLVGEEDRRDTSSRVVAACHAHSDPREYVGAGVNVSRIASSDKR